MKSLTTNSKKYTYVSILLLVIPVLFFASAFLRQTLNMSVPPASWLEKFSRNWSSWLRVLLFAAILILLPLTAVILNFLSLIKLQNDKGHVGIRLINFVIITIAGVVTLLFTVVMLAD